MQSHDILYVIVLRLKVTGGLNKIVGGGGSDRREHEQEGTGDDQFNERKAFIFHCGTRNG
jgi:hypothetical protein